MRILIFTQAVDKNDPVLGFFHGWIRSFASKADSITVICLSKGEFDLPKNVSVYSLGKERGVSKLGYVINLYKYLFLIRGMYDRVFVHMNQEYVLLGGIYWRLAGIPVYMWRNHPAGSLATRIAVFLSKKVFCTSSHSFTARFAKTVIMPVGVDTDLFKITEGAVRKKYSVCMVGRVSPIKHVELALEAIHSLVSSGTQVSLGIIGGVAPKDEAYYESLQVYVEKHNLSTSVSFLPPVTSDKLPEIYNSYEICLNLTESGSFDKTIVEAAASGAIPLVSNESLGSILPEMCITGSDPESIAASVQKIFIDREKVELQEKLRVFVEEQSLSRLKNKLFQEIK